MMLTSCSPEVSSHKKCGVLIPYTEQEDSALRDELQAMKDTSVFPATRSRIFDYKVTRDTIRDCVLQ